MGELPIFHSHSTGAFEQCRYERLTDLLEYNYALLPNIYDNAHSEEEWWISVAMNLDVVHPLFRWCIRGLIRGVAELRCLEDRVTEWEN